MQLLINIATYFENEKIQGLHLIFKTLLTIGCVMTNMMLLFRNMRTILDNKSSF